MLFKLKASGHKNRLEGDKMIDKTEILEKNSNEFSFFDD
jgi:hypothetical protein